MREDWQWNFDSEKRCSLSEMLKMIKLKIKKIGHIRKAGGLSEVSSSKIFVF
jgi:hypothetical protein